MEQSKEPLIIQGGMGIAVSNWQLASAVAREGQLGVVSGTALNVVFAERLRQGDPGGHLREALEAFPNANIANEILETYYIRRSKRITMFDARMNTALLQLTVAANFCEVYLAKQGHSGLIGINYLEKVQLPHLPSLYGAMLAGVDYVLMGAGIPREIPSVLDLLSLHQPASLKLSVEGASSEDEYRISFNPADIVQSRSEPLKRPKFIAVVSSDVLATTLAKKSNGKVDGFVVELPCAGGHNAPPRGSIQLDDMGEPVYGERDEVNFEKIRKLGRPFWLAGGMGDPELVSKALELGACGVQVGTAFAFCQESGLMSSLKNSILRKVKQGKAQVITDPVASPTGFPFKVVKLAGTVSEKNIYEDRPRICQLGFLRKPYKREDGSLGYRCPGEPESSYIVKGGKAEDTIGRKCLCNALMANIGLPQRQRSGYVELPLVTAGNGLDHLKVLLTAPDQLIYSARDVIEYLLLGRQVFTS